MQVQQLSKLWRTVVLLGLGALALFALAACGGDDNDAPADGGTSAQVTEPTTAPTTEPAPTATRVPATPMVPKAAPEPGSDEEQVMTLLEKQVLAVNEKDYLLFQKTCTPKAIKMKTIEQLKFVFEDLAGGYNKVTPFAIAFSPEGYNVRNVEVKLLRAPFAQATLDIYEFDALQGNVSMTFEKVDGEWYSESSPCGNAPLG